MHSTASTLRRGTVYGVLLNHPSAIAALGAAVNEPPYKAPPKAPVLYIKPRNTWAGPGDAIVVPSCTIEFESELEIGATLGLVVGRTACRVREAEALSHVAGCVIVADLSVPHASYYRPSLRFKARDGFCPIGPFVPLAQVGAINALQVEVEIDGQVVQRSSTAGLIRPAARLLADVSEFMTLSPGDVLMLGVAAGAPRARAGQRFAVLIGGLGRLDNTLVTEQASA